MSMYDWSNYSQDSRTKLKSYSYQHQPIKSESWKKEILFAPQTKLQSKILFMWQDHSKKYITEHEVLTNRDQLIKTIQTSQTSSNYSHQQQVEEKQKERLKWTTPTPLITKYVQKVNNTKLKQKLDELNNQGIPKFYNREYQIPDQPSFNIQNQMSNQEPVLLEFQFEINKKSFQTQPELSINKLFVPNTHSIINEIVQKNNDKGILKQTKAIVDQEYIFNEDEETVLKMVLQILCIDIQDTSDFLVRISNVIRKDPQNLNKFKKNVKMVHETIEKFHKFWLQLYNGKAVPLFPKRTLITGDDNPTELSGMMTQNDLHKNLKKKTVPCVYYHSPQGCHRGDKCDFIHDPNYKGVPTPNMDKYVRPMAQINPTQQHTSNFLRKEPPYKWVNGKKVYITMNGAQGQGQFEQGFNKYHKYEQ